MNSGWWKSQLVCIWVPTKDGGGEIATGIPVTQDLVLTARHAVFPPNRDSSKPIEVSWCHIEGHKAWTALDGDPVVWDGDDEMDAALIRCTRPRNVRAAFLAVSNESPKSGQLCDCAGFPKAGQKGDERRPIDFVGNCNSMSPQANHLTIDFSTPPAAARGWQGVSGMPAVVEESSIIGIVSGTLGNFDGKKITAVPSLRLLENPEFARLVGQPARPLPAPAAPPVGATPAAVLEGIRGVIAKGVYDLGALPLNMHRASAIRPENGCCRLGTRTLAMADAVTELLCVPDQIIVVGGSAGSGKTAMLVTLAARLATDWSITGASPFPVALHAPDVLARSRHGLPPWRIDDGTRAPPGALMHFLAGHPGRSWLILDGLDECDGPAAVNAVLGLIAAGARLILACRDPAQILPPRTPHRTILLKPLTVEDFNARLDSRPGLPDSEAARAEWARVPLGLAAAADLPAAPGAPAMNLGALVDSLAEILEADGSATPSPTAFASSDPGLVLANGSDDALSFAVETWPEDRVAALLTHAAAAPGRLEPLARGLLAVGWSPAVAGPARAMVEAVVPHLAQAFAPLLETPGLAQAVVLLAIRLGAALPGESLQPPLPGLGMRRWLHFLSRLPTNHPHLPHVLAGEKPSGHSPWWLRLRLRCGEALAAEELADAAGEADGSAEWLVPIMDVVLSQDKSEARRLCSDWAKLPGGGLPRLAVLLSPWVMGVHAGRQLPSRLSRLAQWQPGTDGETWIQVATKLAENIPIDDAHPLDDPWPVLAEFDRDPMFAEPLIMSGVPLAGDAVALGCIALALRHPARALTPLVEVPGQTVRELALLGWLAWKFRHGELDEALDGGFRQGQSGTLAELRRLWAEGVLLPKGRQLLGARLMEDWLAADHAGRLELTARLTGVDWGEASAIGRVLALRNAQATRAGAADLLLALNAEAPCSTPQPATAKQE